MVRRSAVHRARRGLHDARDLRSARSQYRGAEPDRRRQAAEGRGAGRLHGADDDAASVRAAALLDRRPDGTRAPARDCPRSRQVQPYLGHQHAAGKNRRPGPVRDGALRPGAVRPFQSLSGVLDARRKGRAVAAAAWRDAADCARRQRAVPALSRGADRRLYAASRGSRRSQGQAETTRHHAQENRHRHRLAVLRLQSQPRSLHPQRRDRSEVPLVYRPPTSCAQSRMRSTSRG